MVLRWRNRYLIHAKQTVLGSELISIHQYHSFSTLLSPQSTVQLSKFYAHITGNNIARKIELVNARYRMKSIITTY